MINGYKPSFSTDNSWQKNQIIFPSLFPVLPFFPKQIMLSLFSGGAAGTQSPEGEDRIRHGEGADKFILYFTCTYITGGKDAFLNYQTFETNIPRKGIMRPQSQFQRSCVCGRFPYSQDRSAYSVAVYGPFLRIYKPLTDT